MTSRLAAPALEARIGDHSYPIHLGDGLLDDLGSAWAGRAKGTGVLLVADGGVPALAARAVGDATADDGVVGVSPGHGVVR